MSLDEYIEMHKEESMDVRKIAEMYKLSVPSVYRHLQKKGLKAKKFNHDKRLEEMKQMRNEGKTYQEIGNTFNISRQRVEQILNGHD